MALATSWIAAYAGKTELGFVGRDNRRDPGFRQGDGDRGQAKARFAGSLGIRRPRHDMRGLSRAGPAKAFVS